VGTNVKKVLAGFNSCFIVTNEGHVLVRRSSIRTNSPFSHLDELPLTLNVSHSGNLLIFSDFDGNLWRVEENLFSKERSKAIHEQGPVMEINRISFRTAKSARK